MPKKMPGIAAGRMRRKSSTRRPGQSPRCTSQPAKSAKIAETSAATELKTSVLRSASPLDPVTTKVKCRAVGARLIGKSTVRAETRSVP